MSVRAVAAIAITLFLLHSDLHGADLEPPTFDAVAIRKSADSAWVVLAPTLKKGVLTAANITLRGIVAAAYGLTLRGALRFAGVSRSPGRGAASSTGENRTCPDC